MNFDEHCSEKKYIEHIRQLQYDRDVLQEKYDKLQDRSNERWQEAYKYAQESVKFEAQSQRYRRLFRIFLFISLTFLYLFIRTLIYSSNEIKNFRGDYASGYHDAISGEKPDIKFVRCYGCGYHSADYNAEHITLFPISGLFVPICSDCLEVYSKEPVVILGEEFFFTVAKSS